ncbi:MAG TPA: hypothetical protein VFB72_15490 [Verrucomicrobiae bacterium]|nr:hypothetical protein [Verrucomicrobiae bacterium]
MKRRTEGSLIKAEKELLDRELEQFQREPDIGSSWDEVKERIRKNKADPQSGKTFP